MPKTAVEGNKTKPGLPMPKPKLYQQQRAILPQASAQVAKETQSISSVCHCSTNAERQEE